MNTSISIGLSLLSSAGTRYLLSENKQIPKQQALVFNTVNIAVNILITPYFTKKGLWEIPNPMGFVAARTISWLCAAVVTTAYIGPIKLSHTLALSVSSLVIGFIVRLATEDWREDDKTKKDRKLDLFLAV